MNKQTTDFTPQSLLQMEEGKPFASSLTLAQVFAKSHKHVLDNIRRMAEELDTDFTEPNFRPSAYADETGRTLPAYLLSRDGFTLVAMSFTGKEALLWKVRYIKAFNAMEQALIQSNPAPTQEVIQSATAQVQLKNLPQKTFAPAPPVTIQGLRGFITFWAAIEGVPSDELERTLLGNYGFSSFDLVQKWDTDEMEWSLIKRLFRAIDDITDDETLPEERSVLDGLLDFGVLRGYQRATLEGVISMLCNVPDINHLSVRGVRKATLALWSYLNRFPVRRDYLSEALYAAKNFN